jgi:hypothetical protein
MVILSLSPLKASKSDNYRYRSSWKSDNFRERAIKKEANMIKSNIAIEILET